MKKLCAVIMILLLAVSFSSCKSQSENNSNDTTAIDYISDFTHGSFDKMLSDYTYDESIKSVMTKELLSDAYKSVFYEKNTGEPTLSKKEKVSLVYDSYTYTIPFTDHTTFMKVILTKDSQIISFTIAGMQETTAPSLGENVVQEDITIGEKYSLDGKVTYRKDVKNAPVVILVAGSGANDMDETIYANKPLRDIAYFLSQNGVAVIRYNKRTNQYPKKFSTASCTVEEEVTEDVGYAIAKAKTLDFVDKNKIYIIGHSLGAYLVPTLLEKNIDLAGGVMLCSPYDALEDIMKMQVDYLANLDGVVSKEEKQQIDILTVGYENVKKLNEDNKKEFSANELMGYGGDYWLSLREASPIKRLKTEKKAVMIVGCERDYQVPIGQFKKFKKEFSSSKNITFKSYKNLNHLLMNQGGTMTNTEYMKKANVDRTLLKDVLLFIKNNQ